MLDKDMWQIFLDTGEPVSYLLYKKMSIDRKAASEKSSVKSRTAAMDSNNEFIHG